MQYQIYVTLACSPPADAFIQSDLQMRTVEVIKPKTVSL